MFNILLAKRQIICLIYTCTCIYKIHMLDVLCDVVSSFTCNNRKREMAVHRARNSPSIIVYKIRIEIVRNIVIAAWILTRP